MREKETAPAPAAALVLFDIDGTLIRRAGPHHRQALVEAVRRAAGLRTTTDHIPVQGMLDRDILARMLQDAGAGAAAIRRLMPELVRRAQTLYLRGCPNLRAKVCPGVRRLLAKLAERGIPAGLVTGNLTRIGWRKLEKAGLRSYFRFGAFAEMAADRSALAALAIARAREWNWIRQNARISLVGDHPNDVRAARANGIQAIAVATGLSSKHELAAERPDVLLADLRTLRLDLLLPPAAGKR